MVRLLVDFGPDRDCCGTLTLLNERGGRICGPFPVAGRSSDALAAANKNSARNPLFRYGDTPTGSYALRRILSSGRNTPFASDEFGPHGIAVIEGISGDAACAEANGRFHFLIAGGQLSRKGRLRSTAGGLRIKDEHMRVLVRHLRKWPATTCEINEHKKITDRGRVFADSSCDQPDPYPLPNVARASRSREMLRAGAMAFSFSVSFVALDSRPAISADEFSLQRASGLSEPDRFLLPSAEPLPAYVKLAYNATDRKPANIDIDKFVKYMVDHAARGSKGDCAKACREGLEAAGIDTKDRPGDAKDYGPFLTRHGAEPVPEKDYKPQKGDIAVFDGNKQHPHGHVQVFDGKGWVSDFTQGEKFSPYDVKTTPPSKIYRFQQYLGN